MTLAEKAARIAAILDRLYPAPPIPLAHQDAFSLLVAVVLSAQSTDKKVNEVTPGLFRDAPTPERLGALSEAEILAHIKTVGLAPTKAKNLKKLGELLVSRHQGQVPRSFDELEALPGVGHKTASVVMSQAFGQPAFPVDTHIHRLAARWGLASGRDVVDTEASLKKLFPQEQWNKLHLQLIYFGREHCPALRHDAGLCPVCSWAGSLLVSVPAAESAARSLPTPKKARAISSLAESNAPPSSPKKIAKESSKKALAASGEVARTAQATTSQTEVKPAPRPAKKQDKKSPQTARAKAPAVSETASAPKNARAKSSAQSRSERPRG